MTQQFAILALDQGTTSSRAILFDENARPLTSAQKEFTQHYPHNGWVEHDPEDIWSTTLWAAKTCLRFAKKNGLTVKAIGITNQRETTLVWDRVSGAPLYNAIVWQDRRTAALCARLKKTVPEKSVAAKTGLLIDPYFSATKAAWILDHVKGARARANKGELAFGTVDSFLIFRLTGGARHVTDATNASRTNLFNIKTQKWDAGLCDLFKVPPPLLPEVLDCADNFGVTSKSVLGAQIPILGAAGDQQAALIGQGCFAPGEIKSTYGTGCFMVLNTGDKCVKSKNRLLTTVGYRLGGKVAYALEGSIFMAGATMQWLRDEAGLIASAKDSQTLALSVPDTGGVYMVPAFTGLGAPHWDPDARGAILGLTRGSTKAHIVRAALEAVCYQSADLLRAMQKDGAALFALKVDGGMAANDWLCQYLSNILDIPVERPAFGETTALGAAYLAGRQAGLYPEFQTLQKRWAKPAVFSPLMEPARRKALLKGWEEAVSRIVG